jgi:hypothetical protein
MRMTPHEFFAQAKNHRSKIERAALSGHLRVHHHMKEQVAQLLAEVRVVASFDSVDYLITLLNERAAQ